MSKPYVLGIDIGGTNTVFGIVDARGHVLASSSIKTAKHHNFDDYIAELHAEIMKLLEEINERGTTVLVVTHNREIVNAMKKRVITMNKGVIVNDEKEGTYIDEI